ncbi:hypothetical protein R6231_14545 [Bacillus cytotoxicus]|uniref:hypothetical protein n=1 Tax=Bacillus cereus group TaxID=86661 RepID=UPI0013A535C6|nr:MULTISPECIES: hypothetical protein [Bacillus cereus group]MDH2877605.1 hypothetical protein [Bacillus cytotoxicus]MDH2893734.1 hypothetical protein [Bacillus cytotoxicus]MDH2922674.1 hypothetical protein [Bacillus cytotoxicus]QTR69280.1 hypothetical protein JC776_21540 [Bacillus cytotoxicus]QTR77016.1 hypothetical protein JC772_21550 [Bacillus cytotoxicus]
MRTKEFSKRTHRVKVVQEMDAGALVRKAHSISTFHGQEYIVLDNGNLYDPIRKREVPLARIYRYIKCVRNSYGVIIAKKSNTCAKLMEVKFIRKSKKVS